MEATKEKEHLPLLAVIVLTKNEEANLERCLMSLAPLRADVVVVDSGSTDRTVEIAEAHGVRVLRHPWKNHAAQLNWAIEHLDSEAPWVARFDADEYLTTELAAELLSTLPKLPVDCTGLMAKFRIIFLGRWIKHGGTYPTWLLRIWRRGKARCEDRWMDEYMVLDSGVVAKLENDFVNDNRKGLSAWTEKHNDYSSRELLDLLQSTLPISNDRLAGQLARRRWAKKSLYNRSPLFLRAFAYWFWRYVVRFGFLDGKVGFVHYFLQTFWYRVLVDAKILEHQMSERERASSQVRDPDNSIS